MFFLVVYCIIDLLTTSQCSKISEVHKHVQGSQRDIKKYCSKVGSCEPGTHVACTYYFGQNSMGPKCDSKAKSIKLTKGMQTHILSTINGIRKRLAEGVETGAKQEILPRAYGMVQIQWDQELADLAQLWANQCEDRYDKCRSTEKFPNVAQTDYSLIKMRYTASRDSRENILTANKSEKIINASIDYWRRGKEGVTRQMILNSGYFLEYLQMVHGPNTHLGCGMAAYNTNFQNNKTQTPRYLVIKVVCNWSHQLKQNSMVYDIDPPQGRGGGRSQNCGCYAGQTEGDGCLCILQNTTPLDMEVPNIARTNECANRRAHVVILPIFTFEDGHNIPLSKLRNATAEYINTLPANTRRRYFDGAPLPQEAHYARPPQVPPPARNRMMIESVLNEEPKKPNLKNLKSRDISLLRELVQEYLVGDKHVMHASAAPVNTVALRRSAVKTPRFVPAKIDHPVSYDYTGYFDNSVTPRTRRLAFGLKDSNYNPTPNTRNIKGKELNQLLIALLEDLVYHGNVNDLIAKIHDTEEDRDYKSLVPPPKQIKQNDLIDNLEHYEDEARGDENIYPNTDYGRRIGDEARELVWPTIRKQNPLTHTTYDNNNYDYYANDYDYENEKIIRNIERDILQSNLENEDKYLLKKR